MCGANAMIIAVAFDNNFKNHRRRLKITEIEDNVLCVNSLVDPQTSEFICLLRICGNNYKYKNRAEHLFINS